MLVLPELQIHTALTQGFAAVGSNSALLDDIFANYPATMRTAVKQFLVNNTVAVVLNWPPDNATLPVIAVVNAGEVEAADTDLLGDFLEELEVGNTDLTITEYRGIARTGSYKVLVLTGDPQISLYLSSLVTTLLILNEQTFHDVGMHNILLSESDLRFEEHIIPAWINSRMVTVSCVHYHAVPVTERLLTAIQVAVSVEG